MIATSESLELKADRLPLTASPKISCLILAFNEESRIRTALTHALKWADEVVVVDKGSTDLTCAIAHEYGAKVHPIPFSRQGHERYEDMVAGATHNWVWHFTPGEVPTARVIYAARQLVSDDLDLIRIPTKLWSFGVHDPRSPWGIGYQPRLYNRRRVQFTGICHAPIHADKSRTALIEAGEDCFVYHPTHATADSFIRSHADYCVNEAAKDEPERVLAQAFYQIQAHDQAFRQNPDLLCQQIAWQIYWLQTALHAAEIQRGRDVPAEYRALTEAALREWQQP